MKLLPDKPTEAQRISFYGRGLKRLEDNFADTPKWHKAHKECLINLAKAERDAKYCIYKNDKPPWVRGASNVVDGEMVFHPSLNLSNEGSVKSYILAHLEFCKSDDIGIPIIPKVLAQLEQAHEACANGTWWD